MAGSKSGETSNIYLKTAGRTSTCSNLSRISISARLELRQETERESGFQSEPHSPGRASDTLNTLEHCLKKCRIPQVPFCTTPEIICLPSNNSVTSISESDESSAGVQRPQEPTYRTSYRIFDVQPRAIFEDVPTTAHCTSCGTQVLTCTEYRASSVTWALAGLLCAFGCHLGCCIAPFFFNSVKDVIHLCPLCRTQLGKYVQC